MNRRLLLVTGLAALAACATLPPNVPAPPGAGFELLEPVLAASAAAGGLTIRVRTMGCTAKADFAAFVEHKGAGETVAFGRKRVDACKGPPGVIDLTFAYAELGVDPGRPLFLMNPLGEPHPKNLTMHSAFLLPLREKVSAKPTDEGSR